VAFTPARLNLGVLGLKVWQRPEQPVAQERHRKPLAGNESPGGWKGISWRTRSSRAVPIRYTLVVNVADREGDMHEWFLDAMRRLPEERAECIIRQRPLVMYNGEPVASVTFRAGFHPRQGDFLQARHQIHLGVAFPAGEWLVYRMGEAQRGKPRGAPQRHRMVRSMAQATFTTAYILCGVMDVPLMTLPTNGLQRILDQRRLRGREVTQLTRGFDRTGVLDVGGVRHDQIARDGPGKRRGGMLAVAEEALLGGLARMLTCRENLSMATQTLTWRDLGQEVCAALMFPVTCGARLLTNGMVLPQQHRPMTVDTPLEGYAGPWLMATGAVRLQRRMRRR
jgi:hypothetical protein